MAHGRPHPARLLQGPREDGRPPSASSTASGTRSPATSRPSRPTARSACSAAGRRASTRGARRSTPKRSRPVLQATRGLRLRGPGRPRRALRRERGRGRAGHRRRRPRRGRDGRVVPCPHGGVQGPAPFPVRRLARRARRRARRTMASCARSRSTCSPDDAFRRRVRAGRSSAAAQGEPPRCCGPNWRPGRGRCAWPRRARRRPRP